MQRHAFGYLEPVEKPTAEVLCSYYAERYFQLGRGNYRASYPENDMSYIEAKLRQKRLYLEDLRGSAPGLILDVGCEEGFALAHFERAGWQVEGLGYSLAGVNAMNPHCGEFVTTGDVNTLLEDQLQSSRRLQCGLAHQRSEAFNRPACTAAPAPQAARPRRHCRRYSAQRFLCIAAAPARQGAIAKALLDRAARPPSIFRQR